MAIYPDSAVFENESGRLGMLGEVTEDDPSGRFADLLDSVELSPESDLVDLDDKKNS